MLESNHYSDVSESDSTTGDSEQALAQWGRDGPVHTDSTSASDIDVLGRNDSQEENVETGRNNRPCMTRLFDMELGLEAGSSDVDASDEGEPQPRVTELELIEISGDETQPRQRDEGLQGAPAGQRNQTTTDVNLDNVLEQTTDEPDEGNRRTPVSSTSSVYEGLGQINNGIESVMEQGRLFFETIIDGEKQSTSWGSYEEDDQEITVSPLDLMKILQLDDTTVGEDSMCVPPARLRDLQKLLNLELVNYKGNWREKARETRLVLVLKREVEAMKNDNQRLVLSIESLKAEKEDALARMKEQLAIDADHDNLRLKLRYPDLWKTYTSSTTSAEISELLGGIEERRSLLTRLERMARVRYVDITSGKISPRSGPQAKRKGLNKPRRGGDDDGGSGGTGASGGSSTQGGGGAGSPSLPPRRRITGKRTGTGRGGGAQGANNDPVEEFEPGSFIRFVPGATTDKASPPASKKGDNQPSTPEIYAPTDFNCPFWDDEWEDDEEPLHVDVKVEGKCKHLGKKKAVNQGTQAHGHGFPRERFLREELAQSSGPVYLNLRGRGGRQGAYTRDLPSWMIAPRPQRGRHSSGDTNQSNAQTRTVNRTMEIFNYMMDRAADVE